MQEKFINMNINDDVEFYALIENMQKRYTANRASYYSLTLSDGDTSVDARVWDCNIVEANNVSASNIYYFNAHVNKYGEIKQFVINKIQSVPDNLVDKSKFIKSAPLSKEEIVAEIKSYLKKISNPTLSNLCIEILKDIASKFFEYPAAMSMHHNYLSGLAYHTLTMLHLADTLIELYPGINKDLLYSGVILHDIGKTEELNSSVSPSYSEDGNLLGHIVIGIQMVSVKAKELAILDTEEYRMISHLIASHHGELEFGSPKEPLTMEAYALHYIDLIDSRMASISPEVVKTDKGMQTSPIGSLNRKSLYVPKL